MPLLKQNGLKCIKELHYDRGGAPLPPTFEAKTSAG